MAAHRLICFLCAGLWSLSCAAASPVLLISLDGLHPAYVTQADRYGLKIPVLRRLLTTGAHARGVVGVVPTVTYPSHTTIMTGVAPDVHGILSNTPFDPLNANREGWYWYAEDIKGGTLWEAAANAGLRTASVNWPVTVGDRHIAFLLPEYWRAGTADDLKVLRQLDRPEDLMEQLEAKLGPFVDGLAGTVESDRTRTRFATAILREHRPQLMAVHLIALDEVEHEHGPFVREAFDVLEQLDGMVGELVDAAVASDPASIIAVVSDHGFIATHTAVNLRTRFVEAGLIKLKQNPASGAPVIEDWQAQLWSGGASAAVVLRDSANKEVKARVSTLLQSLAAEPRNGIARVLDKAALQAAGAFPSADFLVEFAPGFYLGTDLRGELLRPGVSKGTHGYLPARPEMHASLFMRGAGIDAGRDLGVIDMRQIAPTLATILGVRLPQKTMPALPLSAKSRSEWSSSVSFLLDQAWGSRMTPGRQHRANSAPAASTPQARVDICHMRAAPARILQYACDISPGFETTSQVNSGANFEVAIVKMSVSEIRFLPSGALSIEVSAVGQSEKTTAPVVDAVRVQVYLPTYKGTDSIDAVKQAALNVAKDALK